MQFREIQISKFKISPKKNKSWWMSGNKTGRRARPVVERDLNPSKINKNLQKSLEDRTKMIRERSQLHPRNTPIPILPNLPPHNSQLLRRTPKPLRDRHTLLNNLETAIRIVWQVIRSSSTEIFSMSLQYSRMTQTSVKWNLNQSNLELQREMLKNITLEMC